MHLLVLRDGDFVCLFIPMETCPHSPLFIFKVGGSQNGADKDFSLVGYDTILMGN